MFKLLNDVDMNDLTYIITLMLCIVVLGTISLYLYHKIYDKFLCEGANKRVSSGMALLGVLLVILIILTIYHIII